MTRPKSKFHSVDAKCTLPRSVGPEQAGVSLICELLLLQMFALRLRSSVSEYTQKRILSVLLDIAFSKNIQSYYVSCNSPQVVIQKTSYVSDSYRNLIGELLALKILPFMYFK